ncbi:MAG: ORF6N domain-containing protein [Flavobacteriaceae bacterium]
MDSLKFGFKFIGITKCDTVKENKLIHFQPIRNKIYEVRGKKVMFDFDLAELYEVVKRNFEPFPSGLCRFTQDEWKKIGYK